MRLDILSTVTVPSFDASPYHLGDIAKVAVWINNGAPIHVCCLITSQNSACI